MIAGVTGHQNLGDSETIAWLNDSLTEEIIRYKITQGHTCLAIGADQLFAQILNMLNIPYIAVVPSEKYEETFDKNSPRENYILYLSKAKEVIRLKFPEPSEEAFYEAGKYVVNHSQIIFAIWNGKAARGLGGTGDVVKYARVKDKLVIHINPISRKIKILK